MGTSNEINLLKAENAENKEIPHIYLRKVLKSNYIFAEVFNFLDEKKKLKMVIYNQKIKNKLGINLNDYKRVSGKKQVGERNGKGKEFTLDKNILVFEGEYKNGKRNGKGKEYFANGKKKFKGIYLNGIKIEGKGYNKLGKLILKIEREGKGKEFYNNGK